MVGGRKLLSRHLLSTLLKIIYAPESNPRYAAAPKHDIHFQIHLLHSTRSQALTIKQACKRWLVSHLAQIVSPRITVNLVLTLYLCLVKCPDNFLPSTFSLVLTVYEVWKEICLEIIFYFLLCVCFIVLFYTEEKIIFKKTYKKNKK